MEDTLNKQMQNRTMPPCTIIPVLDYKNVEEAIDWLCKTFGFTERWRTGSHPAQLIFDGGAVVLGVQQSDQKGDFNKDTNFHFPQHSLLVRVKDANSHYEHARQQGAKILQSPADYPYGERQ